MRPGREHRGRSRRRGGDRQRRKGRLVRVTARPSARGDNDLMPYPERARIVEVGPRDGLQSEETVLSTDAKVELIDRLSASGLTHIEVTAFVNPARIPQLADAEEVCARIARAPNVTYSALVP